MQPGSSVELLGPDAGFLAIEAIPDTR
jgi:hypothetical protein